MSGLTYREKLWSLGSIRGFPEIRLVEMVIPGNAESYYNFSKNGRKELVQQALEKLCDLPTTTPERYNGGQSCP
jgi:hypothetical protein